MRLLFLYLIISIYMISAVKADERTEQMTPLSAYDQSWQQCDHYLIRKGFFFKIADVDWFSSNCQIDKDHINTNPVLLRFTYYRDIKREFFIDSATEYFLRNLNQPPKQHDKAIIENFNQAYQDVVEGDTYDLLLHPQDSLELYKNDRLIQSSQQPLILTHYFKIWFGKDPVIPALKEAFKP